MRLPTLNESPALRYFTFFYLYIMQGIPAGFALTAIANYLLGKHVQPERVGTFIAFVGLPWTGQFIWGPLIDRFQFSVMGHRKHWVVSSQWLAILASLGLLSINDPQYQLSTLSLLFFIHSIFSSIQVASVDAMAISIAPIHERGKVNGFMRGGFLLGIAFGSAVLSVVLHEHGFRSAALIQTLTLCGFSIIFFFTKLDRGDVLLPFLGQNKKKQRLEAENPAFKQVFKKIYAGITNKRSLQYFAVVASVYFCSSVFIRSYTYHLIYVLKWQDKSVSLLQGGWGSIVTFVAIIVAGINSDKMGAKKMQIKVMWAVCLFLILLNLSSGIWHYNLFSGAALLLWNLADPLLSVTIFPILMGLCLKKIEGSQFTTYLALINLCDVVGSYVTGWSLGSFSAPTLGLACGIFLLAILLYLKSKNYNIIPDPSSLVT
ncbi:MAG: MFS transporter [Bacteroidota bacterium]|nr:MFS transporter [Bacteroidota bacterium]